MKIKDYFKLRDRIDKLDTFIIFEIISIVVAILFLKKVIDGTILSNDGYLYFVLALFFSLYYGLLVGVISVGIIFTIIYLFSHTFNLTFFLDTLLIALLGGEFYFYANLKALQLEEQIEYLSEKLRRISRSAFFTKLSHDNLEKNYLVKPYSIRKLVFDIATYKKKDDFLLFLANQFSILSFALVEKEKEYKFHLDEVNKENEIIEEMLFKKEIIYLKDREGEYLAAIPILNSKDELVAYIVIKDISFLKFDIENLIAIQFICNYYYILLEENEMMKQYKNSEYCKYISCKSIVEMDKIVKLNKIGNIESSFLIFEIDKVNSETFENFLQNGLRILDFFEKIKFENKYKFIVVLPFTSKEGAYFFAKRILDRFSFINEDAINNIYILNDLNKIIKLIAE